MNDSVGGAPAMGSSRNLITGGRRPFAGASRLPGSFNVIPDWQRRVDPSGQLLPSETGTGSGPAEVQATVAAKNALVPILYGGYERVAGKVYFVGSNGTYLFVVYIFCEGPIAEITSANVEINDLPYSSYVGTLLNLYDGSQVAADPYMSGNFGWTETLNGYAYAVLVVSQIAGGVQGFPRLTAKLKGFPVYDPRLGSPSASAWSDNPALILADFITRYSGKTVDDTSLIAAADVCDALVSSTGSPTVSEKFSRLTILLREKRTVPEWIDILRGYLPGWVQDHGTHYSIVVDVAGHSVAHVFYSGNIAQDPSPRLFLRGSRDLPDIVRVGYTDTGTTPWSTQYVDAGSGESKAVIELPGIRSSYQARRFAFTRYNHYHLEGIEGEISIFDYGLKVLPGDLATITESAWGWTAQPVRVLEAVDRGNGRWTIRFRVYDAAAYNDEMIATASGATTALPDPNDPPAISSYSINTVQEYYGGRWHVQDRIAWAAPDWPFVYGYRVLMHDAPAGSPTLDGATIFDDRVVLGTEYLSPDLVLDQAYTVWVAVISTTGVQGPWHQEAVWLYPSATYEQNGEEGGDGSAGFEAMRLWQTVGIGSPTVTTEIGFTHGIAGFPVTDRFVEAYLTSKSIRTSNGAVTEVTISANAYSGSGSVTGKWYCYDELRVVPTTTADQVLKIGAAKIVAAGFGSPSEERLDLYAGYWDPLSGLGGTPVQTLILSLVAETGAACFYGSVGIGTTSPQKRLAVSNGGAEGWELDPIAYSGGIRHIHYNRNTSAYIAARYEASQHEFYTYSGSSLERMRIDSAGNVGVNATPSAWAGATPRALQVGHASLSYNSDGVSGYFTTNGYFDGANWRAINTGTGAIWALTLETGGGGFRGYSMASVAAGAAQTLTELVRITPSGAVFSVNVGIGTTPSYKLHVNNNHNPTSTTGYGAVVTSGSYGGGFTLVDTAHCGIYTQDAGETLKIYVGKSAGETAQASVVMVLTGTGNVGIGVTPSYKLDVKGGAGNGVPAQRWEVDGGSNIFVELERDSGGGGTATFGTPTNHNLAFKVNDTTRIFIPAAGDYLQFTSAFHVTSATATGTTPALQSGYGFVPSFTAVAGLTSFTGNNLILNWKRLGNMVMCSGYGVVEASAAGGVQFRISLPIASNLTAEVDLVGGVVANTALGVLTPGYVYSNTTYDAASFYINATAAGLLYLRFWFMYEVK